MTGLSFLDRVATEGHGSVTLKEKAEVRRVGADCELVGECRPALLLLERSDSPSLDWEECT